MNPKIATKTRTALAHAIHGAEGYQEERHALHGHSHVYTTFAAPLTRAITHGRRVLNAKLDFKLFVSQASLATQRLGYALDEAFANDEVVQTYQELADRYRSSDLPRIMAMRHAFVERKTAFKDRLQRLYDENGLGHIRVPKITKPTDMDEPPLTVVQDVRVNETKSWVRSPPKEGKIDDWKPVTIYADLDSDGTWAFLGASADGTTARVIVEPQMPMPAVAVRARIRIESSPSLGMSLFDMLVWYQQHINWFTGALECGMPAAPFMRKNHAKVAAPAQDGAVRATRRAPHMHRNERLTAMINESSVGTSNPHMAQSKERPDASAYKRK